MGSFNIKYKIMNKRAIESVSIQALLITSLSVIGMVTIVLSIISSEKFKETAIDSQQKTLSRILEVSAKETLLQMHNKAIDLGNNTKKPSSFRQLVKKVLSGSEVEAKQNLIELLDDQFHQYYVTGGHLDLQKIRVYNTDFVLQSESSEGITGLTSKLPDFLLTLAKPRTGAERLKAIGGLWQSNNIPLYSVLVPVGGLRLSGYMEIVVSPVHNLYGINQMLHSPLAIYTMGGTNLKQTEDWSSSDNSTSLNIEFVVNGSAGQAVVTLRARENVEYLYNSIQKSQLYTISGFIVLMVIAIVIMLMVLNHYLFKPIKMLISNMKQVADGNLTVNIETKSLKDMSILSTELGKLVASLRDQVTQISQTSEMIEDSTTNVNEVTQNTNAGILRQQTETDLVATAINEMSATVQEVANNASDAAIAANNADDEAKNGTKVVTDTIDSINNLAREVERSAVVINKLDEDAEKINDIVNVIKSIAEQTNLLALNAAIEAARAGEQGRGFAVVADEVRTLASRTQESTAEIQSMIETLQSGTREAVTVMTANQEKANETVIHASKTGDSLTAIATSIRTINEMNTQIAAAAEEQTAVANEINKNIINITQVAEESTAGSEKTTTASNQLKNLARQLAELIERFRV